MKHQEINTGMLAEERTLLAAERTFSAWLRTAITAMGGGLAILRLINFKTELHRVISHVLGEGLIFWGFIIVILASIDYKKMSDKLVVATNYKSSTMGFVIMVVPLMIMSALLIWVTLP